MPKLVKSKIVISSSIVLPFFFSIYDFLYFSDIGCAPDGVTSSKLFSFYEGVAVLLQRSTIDIGLVYELMPTNVTVMWGKYGPLFKQMRVEYGWPQLFRLVEYLSDRLAEHARLRGDPVVTELTRTQIG
ncbi:DUF4760 domain-containing protein [Candidatus Bathyarchaeota archaeon]|nr:DUF4760 domain-containing protein [Candidatus Bathyarchaeota archaeon]